MPDESLPLDGDCAFCDRDSTKDTLLYESVNFYVVADFAPVSDGHILLIPQRHYPHLAALPPELDDEFHELKARLGRFVQEQYGSLTFWENGVFGQSVPHAHLHSISVELDTSLFEDHGVECPDLPSLRAHHQAQPGHYFFIERGEVARVLPPEPELYGRIIRHARGHNGGLWRYSPPERRLHGQPVVRAMIQRWREAMLDLV